MDKKGISLFFGKTRKLLIIFNVFLTMRFLTSRVSNFYSVFRICCCRVSEGIGNPLKFLRGLLTFGDRIYLSEGCQYPLSICQRVLITLYSILKRHLQKGYPVDKDRGCLSSIPLKNLHVKR
jgi:hypothetical protein